MDIGKPLERKRVYPLTEPATPEQEPRTAPPVPAEKKPEPAKVS